MADNFGPNVGANVTCGSKLVKPIFRSRLRSQRFAAREKRISLHVWASVSSPHGSPQVWGRLFGCEGDHSELRSSR
jgi:hypothetical protein